MGHATYEELLDQLIQARELGAKARLETLESIMQALLEKLRDSGRPVPHHGSGP